MFPVFTFVKLFHVADVHLGRRRLDGRLPDSDLADAFGYVADKAIEDAFIGRKNQRA